MPLNAVATNDHKERKYLAYLVNVYEHPNITIWFNDHGIKLNGDAYALSQMLQWFWQSAVREGNRIKIYVPSKRMRQLLTDFLDSGMVQGYELTHSSELASHGIWQSGNNPFPKTKK